jgi:endonuclease/exonuclease/phosphatase family metal-dependent hydrolase
VYQKAPAHDIKIIMGDMNAKVGKDLRAHNAGEHNMMLIGFAVSKDMVISSVRFPHMDIHKETWIHPGGHTKNQIDYVLIDARHASDIIDVKSCRAAGCDSDHYLVKIKYRPRLAIASRSTGTRNVKFNRSESRSEQLEMNIDRY